MAAVKVSWTHPGAAQRKLCQPDARHIQMPSCSLTGFITNGNDANGNPTYAYFSQENVWSVTKVSSNANSITYDITPQWETYGTVNIGIPAPGFPDGPVQVDHYKNGKLIVTYNGWVTAEWCTFDNPDGYSTFVIRKPGTNAQNAKRAYVPNTGVE